MLKALKAVLKVQFDCFKHNYCYYCQHCYYCQYYCQEDEGGEED